MAETGLKISTSERNGWQVITFCGRLDAITAESAQKAILEKFSPQTPKVAADASALDYISSAGIRVMLMGMKNAAKLSGGGFAIINPSPVVRHVIGECGLTSSLGVTDDLATGTK
jgi:anti-anti-sigma factor